MTRRVRLTLTAGAVLVTGCLQSTAAENNVQQRIVPSPGAGMPMRWPSTPPDGCPFEKSEIRSDIVFTGRYKNYTRADTWYPSWASDDKLYSPFTDGAVNGIRSGSGYNFTKQHVPTTGFAVIEGSDPMELKITHAAVIKHEPYPYGGQYPCGSLVYNGVWYYGTYTLDWHKNPWDIMGPFPGFNISMDLGKTWLAETRTALNPMFGESAKDGRPVRTWKMKDKYEKSEYRKGEPGARVKIGAPHFVDFGKNMEHSPDGKAYMVAHGAIRPNSYNSWAAGDQIYLLRVKPNPETINDSSSWEFYGGRDAVGRPVWTADFEKIRPLLEWNDHMGIVTATYIPPLKKYVMCVTDGRGPACNGNGPYDTYLLEANDLTGPWKLVSYLRTFGEQAYFVNIPSKFISPDGKKLWISYSHGWSHKKPNPPGSRYAWCLQEIRFSDPEEEIGTPLNPLKSGTNVALKAKATAGTSHPGYSPAGAIDGKVGGYPHNIKEEWASNNESKGAWIKLTWDNSQKINRIMLFDRPNKYDYITEGELEFSDESQITVGCLPDDATSGREISFPAREVTWLKFTVTGTKTGYPHIGLSEIAAFQAE